MGFALFVGALIFLVIIAIFYIRYKRDQINKKLDGDENQGFFRFALNCGKKAVSFWKAIREDC